MNCKQCGEKLRVTETRDTGDAVFRTRRCDPCDWLYTTKEELIDGMIPAEAFKKRDWSSVKAKQKAKKEAAGQRSL